MMQNAIWLLLAMNAGIAVVFAWGLHREADDWRAMVRDWVGAKGVWIGVLAAYWAIGWIGFNESAPTSAQIVYVATVAIFTFFHARAHVHWFTGNAAPPRADA